MPDFTASCLLPCWCRKTRRIGRDISPARHTVRERLPTSPWREFNFALHQIQQAIEPQLYLLQAVSNWNEIAWALAEAPRTRVLQCSSLQ